MSSSHIIEYKPEILAIIYSIISVLPYDIQKVSEFLINDPENNLIEDLIRHFSTFTNYELIPQYSELIPLLLDDFYSFVSSPYISKETTEMKLIFAALKDSLKSKSLITCIQKVSEILSIYVENEGDTAIEILLGINFISQALTFLNISIYDIPCKIFALKVFRVALSARDPILRQKILNQVEYDELVKLFLTTECQSEMFSILAIILNNSMVEEPEKILKAIDFSTLMTKIQNCFEVANISIKMQVLRLVLVYVSFCSISNLRKFFSSNIILNLLDILDLIPPDSSKILFKLFYQLVYS